MSDLDRIIENVDASMDMENMPLTSADKQRLRNCLEGKIPFQEAVNEIIKKYTKQAM